MKPLLLHSLRTFGMNVVQVVFGFLSSVILARALGPEGRGEYALFILHVGIIAIICNPGIYASANYHISSGQWTIADAFPPVLQASALAGILGGLGSVGLYQLQKPPLEAVPIALLQLTVFIAIAGTIFSSSASAICYGSSKVQSITNWKILYSLVQFACFATVGLTRFGPYGYVLCYTALVVIDAVVLTLLAIRSEAVHWHFSVDSLKRLLGYGIPVYASRLLLFLVQRIDTYLVAILLGTAALGQYSIAVSLVEQSWLVPMSVSMVLMPSLGRLPMAESIQLATRVSRLLIAITAAMGLAMLVVVPWFIPAFYGAEFEPAVAPLLLLLPGTFSIALYVVAEPFFQSRRKPAIPFLATFIGFSSNVIASLILIPRLGIPGAAIAASLGYVFQLMIMCLLFYRLSGISPRELLGIDRAALEVIQAVRERWPRVSQQ